MRALASVFPVVLLAGLLSYAGPAVAQDVQYESVTRVELAEALGLVSFMMARLGGSNETVDTTYIKGRRLRADAGGTSTIMDLDARRMILLDRAGRTYRVVNFDQVVEQVNRGVAGAAADPQAGSGAGSGASDPELEVHFRFSADPANQRERIAGYEAERFFLTIEAEGEYKAKGAAAGERAGTLVVLTDVWMSRSMPAFSSLAAFGEAAGREYARVGAGMFEAIATIFADDPSVRAGFRRSAEEVRRMDGIPMRTVTHFVAVAPEKTFDRPLALGTPREPASEPRLARSGLRGLAGAVGDAVRQAQVQGNQPREEPTQATILKVTSEIRSVSTGSLDASLFEIPAGYREIP